MGRLLPLLLLGMLACARPEGPSPVLVAAAADLSLAFEAAAGEFARSGGGPVRFVFGSSGLLATQLRAGAPYDLYAAADGRFVDQVVASGACDGATRALYGKGRVVAWSKRGGVAPPETLAALAAPRFSRVALANPEHAPYGRAAREALEQAGVWPTIASRVVFAENVRQALQFAETGNVEVALVARSLVIEDRDNPWLEIAEGLHRPLAQELVVCTRGGNRAGGEAFARYLASEPGRALLRRYGFGLTDDGEAPR